MLSHGKFIGSRHEINNMDAQPRVKIDSQSIKRVKQAQVVGFQIDEHCKLRGKYCISALPFRASICTPCVPIFRFL